jgi:hypothetical protein
VTGPADSAYLRLAQNNRFFGLLRRLLLLHEGALTHCSFIQRSIMPVISFFPIIGKVSNDWKKRFGAVWRAFPPGEYGSCRNLS